MLRYLVCLVFAPCILSAITKKELRSFLDGHKSNEKRTEDVSPTPEVEWVCTEGMKIGGSNIPGGNGEVASLEDCQTKCLMTQGRRRCKSIEYGGGRNGRGCHLNRGTVAQAEPSRVIDDEDWMYCEMKLVSDAPYSKADGGSSCHPTTMITDVDECRAAAEFFEQPFGRVTSEETGRPGGCFWDRNGRTYFNEITTTINIWRGTGGICRALTASEEAGQCMYGISNAIFEHPDYSHVHNNEEHNHVCDIVLGSHRHYFCSCMEEAEKHLTEEQAENILAAHPHGVNVEMLQFEKECCCNAERSCPHTEEEHTLECMHTISAVMEEMSETIDLYAYGMNAECDIDDEGAKDYFCGCLDELEHTGIAAAEIDDILAIHTHGIPYSMLGMEASYCCMESGEHSSEEHSSHESSEEDFTGHSEECLNNISEAAYTHPQYKHLHNNTDVNDVCDILLMEHRDYFCGCMEAARMELEDSSADLILAAHPHGINFAGLLWEKECCCNEEQMCPGSEIHAMTCIATISSVMEGMSEEGEDLVAYGNNAECDIDDEGARDYVCECLFEMDQANKTSAQIDEVLGIHTHGITHLMLEMEAGYCCTGRMGSSESSSEESSDESEENFENKAGECLHTISGAVYEAPEYLHLHNSTDVNYVCDILLVHHREYFCGCMDAVTLELNTDLANSILAAHPHGINVEGLLWEKECCCNAAQMCPVEENHAMACMATISTVLEHWAEEIDLLEAYAEMVAAGTCDIDDDAKNFFCGCMSEMRMENATHEDIDAVLSTYSHGITSTMMSTAAGNCCMEGVQEVMDTPLPGTAAPFTHDLQFTPDVPFTILPERKELSRKEIKKQKELLRLLRKYN